MPQWTEPQQAAIDARSSETLVSAAAGSGKTAVLIEHVLKLLREGGRVDRLLIITFTRAAAAELRERLTAALDCEAASDRHLRRQMLAMRHAQICTLHVFCHHILRQHFQAADVDPLARIGENTQLEPLLTRAVDESMEEVCASENPDDIALVTQYGDAQIVDMARELYGFLRAQADPAGWIEEKMADPAGKGLEPYLLLLRKEALMRLEGAGQVCDQALRIAERPGGPDYLAATLETDKALIDAMYQEIRGGMNVGEARFSARARAPKGAAYDAALTDRCVNLREARFGTNRWMAPEDSPGVFIYMEAHVHRLHVPVQREREDQVVVGPVHAVEFKRRFQDGRIPLLVGKLHPGHIFAHFHDDVVQAAGVDIHFFHQVAHFADQTERISLQILDGIGHLGGRKGVAGQQPDHQPFRGIVV